MLQSMQTWKCACSSRDRLGQFVYLGETDAIPEKLNQQIVDGLLEVFNGRMQS
jgi:hypothetical protein